MMGAAGGPSCRCSAAMAFWAACGLLGSLGSSYRWEPVSAMALAWAALGQLSRAATPVEACLWASWGAFEATEGCPVLACSAGQRAAPLIGQASRCPTCGRVRARDSGSPRCASRRVRSRPYAVGGGGGGSCEHSPRRARRGRPVGLAPGSRSTQSKRRLLKSI